jgi:hypothetical protein
VAQSSLGREATFRELWCLPGIVERSVLGYNRLRRVYLWQVIR